MKNAFANILGQQGMGQMPPVMMQQPMQPQQVQTDMFGQQQGGLRQALMMGLMGGQYGRT
jgi:hypothetical protein